MQYNGMYFIYLFIAKIAKIVRYVLVELSLFIVYLWLGVIRCRSI